MKKIAFALFIICVVISTMPAHAQQQCIATVVNGVAYCQQAVQQPAPQYTCRRPTYWSGYFNSLGQPVCYLVAPPTVYYPPYYYGPYYRGPWISFRFGGGQRHTVVGHSGHR